MHSPFQGEFYFDFNESRWRLLYGHLRSKNTNLKKNICPEGDIFPIICTYKHMRPELEVLPAQSISSSAPPRDAFFEELYESAFPAVAGFVSQMNGSFQDAKDIFQDALIIYFERSTDPQFSVNATPERYILGIAKHLWIRKFKEKGKNISLNTFEAALSIPVDFFPSVQSKRVLQFIEQAGKKCLDLLRSFYYDKLTMKELAQKFEYSSEHSVTVQKYKCIEKVRESVKERSITYEDFFE